MKNTLLMAMSTLPANIKKSTFRFVDDNGIKEYDDCESQLEPVTKMMLEKTDKLDIVILCSKESIYTAVKIVNKDTKDSYIEDRFAVNFFINRICEYQNIDLPVNIEESKVIHDEITIYNSKNIRFILIPFDENDMENSVCKVVKFLRNKKEEEKKIRGKFVVDTHGGFRDVSLVMNSILTLLKVDDILVDEVYGIRYNTGDEKSNIVSTLDTFNTFDFVTGMNEFIKFGSTKYLQEYYRKTGHIDECIKNVLDAMNMISDGTLQCDPSKYIQGLDDLGEAIDKVEDNSLFSLFRDYIKDDYGILLDSSKRKNIDVVERCYKKGMYQQTLTFIEALMPLDYFDSHILYFEESERSNVQSSKMNDSSNDSDEYYAFDRYIKIVSLFGSGNPNRNLNIDQQVKIIVENCNSDLNSISPSFIYDNITIYNGPRNNRIPAFTVSTKITSRRLRDKKGRLMHIHKALKKCRNMMNHVSQPEYRPNIESIDYAIKTYIRLYREIVRDM